MAHELTPTLVRNINHDFSDFFHFTIGNVGFKIRLESGLMKRCLSVFIQPIVISPNSEPNNPIWMNVGSMKEFLIPVHTSEPLLQYAKYPFDHIQWGKNGVKLFWQREVIQISSFKTESSFELNFKKLFWDGISLNPETGVRRTQEYELKEGMEYSLNITNGLTRENYQQWIEENNLESDESFNSFVRKEKTKLKVNKLLGHIGLQLKE